jgi:hypothetical protein
MHAYSSELMAEEEAHDAKKAETRRRVAAAFLRYWHDKGIDGSDQDAEAAAEHLVESFVTITAPESEPLLIGLFVMDTGGRSGGQSRKPGNLMLNMRTLTGVLAKGAMTLVTVYKTPWAAPFAALVLWNEIWAGMTVDVAEREAIVMWTMWTNRDDEGCVAHAPLPTLVNAELGRYGRQPLSSVEPEARHNQEVAFRRGQVVAL